VQQSPESAPDGTAGSGRRIADILDLIPTARLVVLGEPAPARPCPRRGSCSISSWDGNRAMEHGNGPGGD